LIEGIIPSEILEGPAAIRATLAGADTTVRQTAQALRSSGVRRAWVIGNGTSYHSSLYATGLYRRFAGPDDPVVLAATAGDFRTFTPRLGAGDAVVGISSSGEFRDVVGVFEELRGRVPTVAVVHVRGSTLTRIADHVVVSSGGPSHVPVMTKTFSSTLTATTMLLSAFLGDAVVATVANGLRRAADDSARAIEDAWPLVEDLARSLLRMEHLFVVGGGLAYPAAMEVALKLKEMALVHAEASETWEMAAGPATMVGAHTAVISLAPDGPARASTDDVVRHCADWGARIIEVAPSRAVTDSTLLALPAESDERFAVLTAVPPVALVAYALARLRGATPDRPSWTERYHSQGLTHIMGIEQGGGGMGAGKGRVR
jgi:glutamine---fructose-6-phosphate transaminase (isomerizing)